MSELFKSTASISADLNMVRGKPLHESHDWMSLDTVPVVIACRKCRTDSNHPDAREPCKGSE